MHVPTIFSPAEPAPRTVWLALATCLLAVLGCARGPASETAAGSAAGAAAGAPPNVVLIVADDLGWNDVGYHGSEIRTPHLDRLAAEGVRLERFYVAPICTPTRAGLLTGRSPIRYGLMRAVIPPWRRMGLPLDETTLPEALAAAGYAHRGAVGKWHLGHFDPAYHPLNRGFTEFYGHYNGAVDYFTHERDGELDWHEGFAPSRDEGYATDLLTDRAVRFIQERGGDAPFFLYLAYNAPHTPLQAPEDALARYPELEGDRRVYAAMVSRMDAGIGRVLDALEERGVADNTLVWFTSDNGGNEAAGADNAPLRAGKQHTFEGGIRVPALVRWPAGIPGARTMTEPLAYTDVFPTVLRAAGIGERPGAKPLDGVDVLGALRGEATLPPRDIPVYWAQSGDEERLALVRGSWKTVFYGPTILEPTADAGGDVSLFDLEADPSERHDRSAAHPERVAASLEALQDFRRLRPADGIPPYAEGREGFTPPKDWRMDLYGLP